MMTLAAACTHSATDSVVPDPGAGNLLAGTWVQDISIPGASLAFTVTTRDTTVSGTGTYSIEAGRSGTLTVSGAVTASGVSLDFTYDHGALAHFDGAPPSATVLTGALKNGPKDSMVPSYQVTFHRKS